MGWGDIQTWYFFFYLSLVTNETSHFLIYLLCHLFIFLENRSSFIGQSYQITYLFAVEFWDYILDINYLQMFSPVLWNSQCFLSIPCLMWYYSISLSLLLLPVSFGALSKNSFYSNIFDKFLSVFISWFLALPLRF